MAAQTKLNPEAPEFFPINYQLTRHSGINPLLPLVPLPNSNSSIYYSTPLPPPPPPSSSFVQFSDSSYPNNETLANSVECLMNPGATQLLHEVPGVVSSSGGKRGRRSYGEQKWRGRGRHTTDHSKKQLWRARNGDASDYSINCNRRKDFVSMPNHPILPVESDGQDTTVLIRNIPNRYTRELLMEFLDEHCMKENESSNEKSVSAFDFLYLPIDFKNKVNKGYAFVNFTNPKAVWKFKRALENKRWPLFLSSKVCTIAYARLQGKEELVRHFERSIFECERDDYLPVTFSPARDGTRRSVEQKVIGRRVR